MIKRLVSEQLWEGEYGNNYTDRSRLGKKEVTSRRGNLEKCLLKADKISSSLEIGSNIGYNEIALRELFPEIEMEVIEVNKHAADECKKIPKVKVNNCSLFDYELSRQFDLSLVHGILIYIEDEELHKAYELLYKSSKRYILIIEYYNPTPLCVNNNNPERATFVKRDFAGEMMDLYKDLQLLDYGFIYHRDGYYPMDDFNWFLLEKGNHK